MEDTANDGSILPPIIVFESPDGWIQVVFDDVETAGNWLEAYDIDETGAYDSRGLRLVLSPRPNYAVHITASDPPLLEPEQLRRLIASTLKRLDVEHEEHASLASLVALAHDRFRYEPWQGWRAWLRMTLAQITGRKDRINP